MNAQDEPTFNLRCKCEWCEEWNQGSEPWVCHPHPSHSENDIIKIKKEWAEIYSELEAERKEFEHYNKYALLSLADDILEASGPFNETQALHSLALGIRQLLRSYSRNES